MELKLFADHDIKSIYLNEAHNHKDIPVHFARGPIVKPVRSIILLQCKKNPDVNKVTSLSGGVSS